MKCQVGKKLKVKIAFPLLLFSMVFSLFYELRARAGEMGPLIQTTSFQSDFEGLVYFDLLENVLLEEGDCQKALENVKNTFVRIQMGEYYGCGNIFDITKEEIIVISNRHVLQYWTKDSFISFMDGRAAEGELLYLSEESDVGFLRIPVAQFAYEELVAMRSVRKSRSSYEELKEGEGFFVLDITEDRYHPEMYPGKILEKAYYIEAFDTHMIYTQSFAKKGMSGSGMFNHKGAYIGMVTAGTLQNELAGVPLPDILEAYRLAGNQKGQDSG